MEDKHTILTSHTHDIRYYAVCRVKSHTYTFMNKCSQYNITEEQNYFSLTLWEDMIDIPTDISAYVQTDSTTYVARSIDLSSRSRRNRHIRRNRRVAT